MFSPSGSGATLTGTAGTDVIYSSAGSDTMTGNGGGDTFVFKDSTKTRSPTTRRDHTIFADVAAVVAATTSDASNYAVITHGTDTVTLTGVTVAQFTAHQSDIHTM